MIFFVIAATIEAYREFKLYGACIYAVFLVMIFFLAIYSLVMTFTTHPGEVTDDLIKRLKSQLMSPKQVDNLFDIHGEKQRTQYVLKCLNRAILRHI